MKDIDKIVRDNINKKVTEIITEASRNAKKRNEKNIMDVFRKGKSGYNAIRCFAIFTAENSDSIQQPRSINKKSNHSLLQALKQANYVVIPTLGKFGNEEHSYCVINIGLEAVMSYCGKFEQTSFIYSVLHDEQIQSQYYEKSDVNKPFNAKTNPYILKDECSDWNDEGEADDYYTLIGKKFKFSIPFSIFESINDIINQNLKMIILKEGKTTTEAHRNAVIDWTICHVGNSPFLWRKALYKGVL